jgi:hypothetical protein
MGVSLTLGTTATKQNYVYDGIRTRIHFRYDCHHPVLKFHLWGSTVGIATGYRLVDQGVGIRVLVGAKIFTSPRCPNWL